MSIEGHEYSHGRICLAKIIATSFGAGYWPWGPGTAGALFAIALWCPLWLFCSPWVIFGVTAGAIIIFTALGVWSGTVMESLWGKDPSKVVMDETVGQWLALLPVGSFYLPDGKWWWVLAAFVLFRAFDIIKPMGIRRLERLGGGLGIMADDIAAGTLSAFLIAIAQIIVNLIFYQ